MIDAPPPVPTGKHSEIDLSGMLFLWSHEQPVIARIVGEPRWCLPIFSTKETLDRAVRQFNLVYQSIKQIEDHHEFLASIRESARNLLVILDPRQHGAKVRYMDVKYEGN